MTKLRFYAVVVIAVLGVYVMAGVIDALGMSDGGGF